MPIIYLRSEVVDTQQIINALIEIGWGVGQLKSLIAFGSATKSCPVIEETITEQKKTFICRRPYERTRVIKKLKPPNDIDILAIYKDGSGVKKEDLVRPNHKTPFKYVIDDGYGGILKQAVRTSKYHLFKVSEGVFLDDLDSKDSKALTILNEGVVIWGENQLVFNKASESKYGYVYETHPLVSFRRQGD